jgi:hypothetical protein
MMGDYHVRFREWFRGETPLYLLDHTDITKFISQENVKNWFFGQIFEKY